MNEEMTLGSGYHIAKILGTNSKLEINTLPDGTKLISDSTVDRIWINRPLESTYITWPYEEYPSYQDWFKPQPAQRIWIYPSDGSLPYELNPDLPPEKTSWKCIGCNKIWAPHIDCCKTCS